MQWNINGVRSKQVGLQTFLQELNPKVIALQETKMEKNVPMKIKHFKNIYRNYRTNRGGGVCIAVHDSIPSYEIKIDTNLEIVVCRIVFKNNSLNNM